MIVGADGTVYMNANLKAVIAARLAGIYAIDGPAVRSGIEMAAGACLYVVAAGLHFPEQSFSQLCGGGPIGKDSFHSKDGRDGNAGKGSERTQRNNDMP